MANQKEMQPYELDAYLGGAKVSEEQYNHLLKMGGQLDEASFTELAMDCVEAFFDGDERVPSAQPKVEMARVRFPSAFLHPHIFTAKDGREFEKAFVTFPEGTKINGINIGGFSCDIFLNDHMKQQMLLGGDVTLRFKSDEKVSIWKGSKGNTKTPYQHFEINPWDLVKGLKAEYEGFKAAKAAERQQGSPSLRQEAQDQRQASDALSGHDAQQLRPMQREA